MNVGVANRHWDTAGGGEAYALALARSLRGGGHSVTLVGPPGTAWDDLDGRFATSDSEGERSGGPAIQEVSFDDEVAFSEATARCDLVVNAGHATQLPCEARAGILVVHFPRDHGRGLGPPGRILLRALLRRSRARNTNLRWGRGFYASGEVGRLLRWTDGNGTLVVEGLPPGRTTTVTVTFGTDRPTTTRVVVSDPSRPDQDVTATVDPRDTRRLTIPVTADGKGVARVTIVSDTFVPAEVWSAVADRRPHGVPVVDVTVGRNLASRVLDRIEAWRRSELLAFTTSYDVVLCHSHYTAGWVRRWWGLSPRVVEPPVSLRNPGDKASIILAVGRFFDPRRGHSKRQLEMVEAFERLVESGAPDWELHLVGGCHPEDVDYLDAVRTAADGLPVHVHVDAPSDLLDDLYARASLFWHATGLGVDPESDPEAHEHFGIAVVEAMSAGAVPLVHGTGGPAEIVRDGVDGHHFTSLEELVERTRALVDDSARRRDLARSARERSLRYSAERFDEAVARVVADVAVGGRNRQRPTPR